MSKTIISIYPLVLVQGMLLHFGKNILWKPVITSCWVIVAGKLSQYPDLHELSWEQNNNSYTKTDAKHDFIVPLVLLSNCHDKLS